MKEGLEFGEITPTLIIGVGGTGIKAIQYVKARMEEIPPAVRLLGVDVAVQTTPPAGSVELNGDEFIKLGVAVNVQDILDKLDRFERIKRWIKPGFVYSGTLEEGADQRRLLGKLALCWNLERETDNIYSKLEWILRDIRSEETIKKTEGRYGINKVNGGVPARVFIISSFGGGTGSGIFLDLAYLIRKIVSEVGGHNDKIIGILVLPEAFTEGGINKPGVKANTYAALMELEYFIKNGFECKYTPTLDVSFSSKEHPFTYIYLINGVSETGITYNQEGVIKLISDVVYSFLGTDINAYTELLTNMRAQITPQNFYNSFGFSSIVLPIDEIIDYCAYSKGMELADEMLKLANRVEVEKKVNTFISGQKIGETDLITKLNNILTQQKKALRLGEDLNLEGLSADDVDSVVNSWKGTQVQKLAEVRKFLNEAVEEAFSDDESKGIKDKKKELEEEVNELTNDHKSGLIFAMDFLGELDIKLSGWDTSANTEKGKLLKYINADEGSENGLKGEYKATLKSILATIIGARRSARESLEGNLKRQNEKQERMAVLDAYTSFYPKLGDKITDLKGNLGGIKSKLEDIGKDFGKSRDMKDREIKEDERNIEIDLDWFLKETGIAISKQKEYLMSKEKIFEWKDIEKGKMGEILFNHLREACKELEGIGIVDYMEKTKIDYKKEIINLEVRTSPLWQYDRTGEVTPIPISLIFSGKGAFKKVEGSVKGKSNIGVKPSKNEHQITCAKYSHGLPIKLLNQVKDYRSHYLFRKESEDKDNWPLHVDYSIEFEDIVEAKKNKN